MIKLVWMAFSLFFCETLLAAAPSIDNIDQGDLDKVVKEFSANFAHAPVSPPSSLGKIFGFELGAVAGATSTPEFQRLVKEVDPDTNIPYIPHAGIFAALSVPFGITLEANLIPKTTVSDVSIDNVGLGLKWTMTNVFWTASPFDLALRAHYSSSQLSFKQTVQNASTSNQPVDAVVTYDSNSYGVNLSAGARLIFIEPYAGLGFIKGKGDLSVSGSSFVSIFNTTFSSSQSASSDATSAHLFAGLQFDLLLFHLGFEYGNAFGVNRYSAKLSLAF